jgi:hypothetical protein
MTTPADPPVSQTTKALGFEPVPVTFRDGTTGTVNVRTITIREVHKFLDMLQEEADLVEFLTLQEKGWDDKLLPASHELLIERGFALNHPICEGYWNRQKRNRDWLTKEAVALVEVLKKLASRTSSAKPPAPSDAPSTPSSA